MKTGGFENKYTDATVLQNAFKRVELTTENWQDYLELKEERLEDFDAFGESLGTYVICNYVGLKDPSVSRLSDDTVIRFTFTENYNYIDKYQDDGEIANEENYEWVQEVDISNFYHNSDIEEMNCITRKAKVLECMVGVKQIHMRHGLLMDWK